MKCHLAALLILVANYAPVAHADNPPSPRREFRGAWVATVYNLDWPSKPGLSAAAQQAELRTMFQRVADLNLNAVIFQVRPQCDALYASRQEPWSPVLTGKMGGSPGYDPLEFAVAEAHARGLELHAWFNPFRALANASAPVSPNHVSKQHPEWVRRYGTQLWLDPGEIGARDHALAVILDVVRRYDIDGVHIDDYFYPYPTKERTDFPDDAPWKRYRAKGGKLERADWRRDNINQFVEKLNSAIKAEKKWVKFGISPFGIWRPGVPSTIEAGLDSYAHLYADSRKWLNHGWCDYFTPQLYWSIEPAKQSFPVLLDWWRSQNLAHRHLWPGVATERVGPKRPASEITSQIAMSRRDGSSPGHVHWSVRGLLRNLGGVSELLRSNAYAEPAVVPASPWLGRSTPPKPALQRAGKQIRWELTNRTQTRWWLVQSQSNGKWNTQLQPPFRTAFSPEAGTQAIAVRAVDYVGNLSEPTVLTLN